MSASSDQAATAAAASQGQQQQKQQQQQQRLASSVNDSDVLLGRGAGPNDCPGNVAYRAFIRQRMPDYTNATVRGTKTRIALRVVSFVHERGGRFLRKIERDDLLRLDLDQCVVDDRERIEAVVRSVAGKASSTEQECDSKTETVDKQKQEPDNELDTDTDADEAPAVYAVITHRQTLVQKTKQAIRHMIRGAKQQQQQHECTGSKSIDSTKDADASSHPADRSSASSSRDNKRKHTSTAAVDDDPRKAARLKPSSPTFRRLALPPSLLKPIAVPAGSVAAPSRSTDQPRPLSWRHLSDTQRSLLSSATAADTAPSLAMLLQRLDQKQHPDHLPTIGKSSSAADVTTQSIDTLRNRTLAAAAATTASATTALEDYSLMDIVLHNRLMSTGLSQTTLPPAPAQTLSASASTFAGTQNPSVAALNNAVGVQTPKSGGVQRCHTRSIATQREELLQQIVHDQLASQRMSHHQTILEQHALSLTPSFRRLDQPQDLPQVPASLRGSALSGNSALFPLGAGLTGVDPFLDTKAVSTRLRLQLQLERERAQKVQHQRKLPSAATVTEAERQRIFLELLSADRIVRDASLFG